MATNEFPMENLHWGTCTVKKHLKNITDGKYENIRNCQAQLKYHVSYRKKSMYTFFFLIASIINLELSKFDFFYSYC